MLTPAMEMKLTTALSAPAVLVCWRCRQETDPVRPWPHWRKARFVYFGGLLAALCGGPVILADGFVLIPTLMLYLAALGPLNALARQRPVCNHCGAAL